MGTYFQIIGVTGYGTNRERSNTLVIIKVEENDYNKPIKKIINYAHQFEQKMDLKPEERHLKNFMARVDGRAKVALPTPSTTVSGRTTMEDIIKKGDRNEEGHVMVYLVPAVKKRRGGGKISGRATFRPRVRF